MTTPAIKRAREVMQSVNAAMRANVLTLANDPHYDINRTSSGLLPADILWDGGLAAGRFFVLVGDFSTLKSYIGLCCIAQVQKAGGTAALIDTEHAFDRKWATAIGVDVDSLIMVPRPHLQSGEQAIDYAEQLIRQGVDLIVFDSVAAALPQSERNKRLHDENVQPARLAQLMSLAMRKLTAANDHTAVLWINQLRINLGITFGSPDVATGGRALPYYASTIMEIKKLGKVTRNIKTHDGDKEVDAKELVAQKYKATITKSKLSRPWRDILFDWSLETNSIDLTKFLVAQGLEHGLVIKKGNSWNVKGSTKKTVGREKFMAYLDGHPTELVALENAVRDVHGLPHIAAPSVPQTAGPLPEPRGSHGPAKRKAAVRKVAAPRKTATKRTQGPAQGRSKATLPMPARSSSTKTR